MRRAILCFLGTILWVSNLPGQSAAIPGITNSHLIWLQNYTNALKQAEAEKKPVFIDVTTDWCGWSKKMDQETIHTPEVQKLLEKFVLVRLNPEASPENEKIAEAYGVDGYPHFILANYQGEDIGHLDGYAEKKDFIEFIQKHLPLFADSPLGYRVAALDASDPLFAAIQRIPAPESYPANEGSFIVLDQCTVQVDTNGAAKYLIRTATFVADPEKGDLPDAVERYNSSQTKLKFKTVRVLDSKGKGREVNVDLAKDEHAYSNQNVYWDVRQLSLDLPKLKAGQILDVVEEVESQPVMPGQFYFHWNIGTKILLMSELKLTFPASLKMQKLAIRCTNEVKEISNHDGSLTWTLSTSNPESFEPAPFSPPFYEIMEGYDFFTPCTTDQLSHWFASLCSGRDQLPAAALQKVASIKQAHKTQVDQLQAILDWVTKDIRYVSVAFGKSSHQPHRAAETLENLYGDCKDQSMLLKSLCQEAGIPAAMVLVNAYGQNFNTTNPAVEMFDHCIVTAQADGKWYYLDPAADETKLGRVPRSYAGSHGLKIDTSKGEVVKIPPYQPSTNETVDTTWVKLNPNGSATVTNINLYTGNAARLQREKMKETTPDKVRRYLEDSYKRSGRKLLDFHMTDPANTNAPVFELRISYTLPRFGSMTSGGFVFKAYSSEIDSDWISLLNLPRKVPFKFYASDIAQRKFVVELPPGATLKARPDNLLIDTKFMQAARTVESSGNILTITENSGYRDASLPATEAGQISSALQKLTDHRNYSYIVQMPARAADAAK